MQADPYKTAVEIVEELLRELERPTPGWTHVHDLAVQLARISELRARR